MVNALTSLVLLLYSGIYPFTSDFAKQLKQVVLASTSGYSNLKGKEILLKTGETAYSSLIKLEGTVENKIGLTDGKPYYMAKILGRANEQQAIKTLKLWKSKVESTLGSSYMQTPFRSNDKKALRDGYVFYNERVYISLYWINYEDRKDYEIFLVIIPKN